MAIQAAASESASFYPQPVPVATEVYDWDYCTGTAIMTEQRLIYFAHGVPDFHAPHFNNEVARRMKLRGIIVHGALVRATAINHLCVGTISKLLGVESTHVVAELDGDYHSLQQPVYPDDMIYVQFNLLKNGQRCPPGTFRVRSRGTFPIEISFGIFILREELSILSWTGKVSGLVMYIPEVEQPEG